MGNANASRFDLFTGGTGLCVYTTATDEIKSLCTICTTKVRAHDVYKSEVGIENYCMCTVDCSDPYHTHLCVRVFKKIEVHLPDLLSTAHTYIFILTP